MRRCILIIIIILFLFNMICCSLTNKDVFLPNNIDLKIIKELNLKENEINFVKLKENLNKNFPCELLILEGLDLESKKQIKKLGIKNKLIVDTFHYKNFGNVGISIVEYYNVQDARDYFNYFAERIQKDYEIYEINNNSEDNRSMISHLKQSRTDPEGFSRLMDEYSSYIIFQKGNFYIQLFDLVKKDNINKKEDLFKKVAIALKEASE